MASQMVLRCLKRRKDCMLVSELVAKLAEAKEKHGDAPVVIEGDISIWHGRSDDPIGMRERVTDFEVRGESDAFVFEFEAQACTDDYY